jgi:predicted GNAT family N-acyltransferase
MNTGAFTIRDGTWQADRQALQSVRIPVFVVEQKVDAREEFDEVDVVCRHILACDLQGKPIGTGRIDEHGKIGRMAVLPEWRKFKVGRAILDRAVQIAVEQGLKRAYLHAQVSAVGFYARAGFEPFGEHFVEAGIEHVAMERSL